MVRKHSSNTFSHFQCHLSSPVHKHIFKVMSNLRCILYLNIVKCIMKSTYSEIHCIRSWKMTPLYSIPLFYLDNIVYSGSVWVFRGNIPNYWGPASLRLQYGASDNRDIENKWKRLYICKSEFFLLLKSRKW